MLEDNILTLDFKHYFLEMLVAHLIAQHIYIYITCIKTVLKGKVYFAMFFLKKENINLKFIMIV